MVKARDGTQNTKYHISYFCVAPKTVIYLSKRTFAALDNGLPFFETFRHDRDEVIVDTNENVDENQEDVIVSQSNKMKQ